MKFLASHSFSALGSNNSLQFFCESSAIADLLIAQAVAETKRIEQKFSRFRPESLLSQINRAAGTGAWVEVDEEMLGLLNYANAAYETSNGLFDITSGVLSRLWNFKERAIPTDEQIQRTKLLVGWKKIEWQPPRVRLPTAGMELDLGGIGKEYAVDRVSGILLGRGVRSGIVNLGGDIRILGPSPTGEPWNIGIVHPRLPDDTLAGLSAREGAIATSGDYERFFELDGKRYCHIIHPGTGFPVEGIQAVTVFAPSCTIAGTAATVAMLHGPKAGRRYLDELGLPYILVENESRLVVQGFSY